MLFADPAICPDCRADLAGSPRCPRCGLDLQQPEVRELWQTLLNADALLDRARARRDEASRAATAATVAPPPRPDDAGPGPSRLDPQAPGRLSPPPPPAPPQPSTFVPTEGQPAYPAAPSPPPPGRSWSVGNVLLGVGAFGLVVAAIIFVSRSWDAIGVLGKAAILLAATAVVAAAAIWVTRRPLRASAEALWAVVLAMVALDLGAARGEGLLGLDAVTWSAWNVVLGLVVTALGAGVLIWARRFIERDLVSPALGILAGVASTGLAAASLGDLGVFWHVFVGGVVVGLLGLALRVTGSTLVAIGCRVILGVFFAVGVVTALDELIDHASFAGIVVEGHGAPMLLVSIGALAIAFFVEKARVVMTAVGALGLASLPIAATGEAGPVWWLAVLGVVAAASTIALRWGSGAWIDGLRWAVGVLSIQLAFAAVSGMGLILGASSDALDSIDAGGYLGADAPLPSLGTDDVDVISVIVAAVAMVVTAWFIGSWPVDLLRSVRHPLTAGAVGGSVGVLLVVIQPTHLVAVLVLLALAVAATVVGGLAGSTSAHALAILTLVPACLLGTAEQGLAALAFVVGALVLAVVAVWSERVEVRAASAVGVAPMGAVGVGLGCAAAGAPDVMVFGPALVVALAVLAVAVVLRGRVRLDGAVGLAAEGTSLVTAAIVAILPTDALTASLMFTLVGATLIGLGVTTADRRWFVWPGIAALVVAYALALVDGGFDFVEAYTLPPGIAALGAGLVWMRRSSTVGSWPALGGGLALTLLPSLPQALAEPDGPRALILGAGALVVLIAGVRFGWQAPFVVGAVVAVLLLLFNIGPYANAAPRVLIIAGVSAVLVAVGVTWEDRVRDGRQLVAFVRGMR